MKLTDEARQRILDQSAYVGGAGFAKVWSGSWEDEP